MGTRPDGRHCPRPRKRVYDTVEEAWAHIAADFPDDEQLAPYRCHCGLIHIGHSPRRHTPEIRAMLAALTNAAAPGT